MTTTPTEKYVSEYLYRKSLLLQSLTLNDTVRKAYRNFEIKFKIHLHGKAKRTELFGSCARRTNLPPKYDPHTDLDVLVVFDDDQYDRTPETYREQLRRIVLEKLRIPTVQKRLPAVVISQDSMNVDLVPCVLDRHDRYRIPDSDNGWRLTDPHDYTEKVASMDEDDQSHLLAIIRMLKYWNVQRSERVEAFELESRIIDAFTSGDSLADEFLSVVDDLDLSGLPQSARQALESLTGDIHWLRQYVEGEQRQKTKDRLARIFRGAAFLP